MKKMLLVLFMIALCASFFFIVSNRKSDLSRESRNIDILSELQKDRNNIAENYPGSPKELIELHNKIMSYLYSQKMQDEYVDLYSDTIRNLYSEDILSLNSKESQAETILLEKEENQIKMVKLLESKIEEVIYLDNENMAQVKVLYYINSGDITRIYSLENTSEGWKITGWNDSQIDSKELEAYKDE
ncbi:DUF6715 family protein [Cellulosilyticum sp. I15G10I2]|uniref:DUF6715 family protein n=1 Tax=Cellulosilyticum sp. I15G10I2 TaxID=1892843 RepID=UPI00085BEBAC|nr:DUF6715 family protein [Cellulosilyticum sp. I15G10I2]